MRTLEVLQGADVVFLDGRVAKEVLGLIPARAAVHNIEKLCGLQEGSREEIHKRILRTAQNGQTVVLLRGADSSILEQTQDEIAALRDAGIDYEFIPGAGATNGATTTTQTTHPRDKQQEIVLQLPPHAELLAD